MTRTLEGVIENSNSEIQAFDDCRRRWWLSYFRGLRLRLEAPKGPLSIGNRVHKALETGFPAGDPMKALALSISADVELAEQTGTMKEFQSDAELAVIMVQGFLEWAAEEGLDHGWELVAPERVVRAPGISLHGELVVLKGKLDQLVRREMDGSLWMRDWKTTQTMTPVMMQFGPQLKTYILLLQLTEVDAQVSGGQFVFLKKVRRTARANPPFYSVEPMTVSSRQMEAFWKQTIARLDRMVQVTQQLEAGGDHQELCPPRPTKDCSWRCPFYRVCEMFDDGSNVELALEQMYEVRDPYAYYEEVGDDDKETT